LRYDARVAVSVAPRARRSLVGTALAAAQSRLKRRARSDRLARALAVARQHVMTAAALAAMDLGAFHWGAGVGWVAAGLSLLALDFAVTG
jgi:hypothetical protein